MKHLFLCLMMAMAAGACTEPDPDSTPNALENGNNLITNALITADIGDRIVDGPAEISADASFPDSPLTDLYLVRQEGDQMGMVILRGVGQDVDGFSPGAYIYDNNDDVLDDGEMFVQLCSGPSTSSVTYEAPGTAVGVTVTTISGGRHYVVSTVGDGDRGQVYFDILKRER